MFSQLPELWRDQFMVTREIPGQGICAVQRFVYTCGLLTNLRFDGMTYDYSARYCYPDPKEARRDLATWNGVGDPPGEWVKEKVSERRRVPDPFRLMSDHDLLGTLRGLRKQLRRLHVGWMRRGPWTPAKAAESARLWTLFYQRLDACIERDLVRSRGHFTRENVISPRWGCAPERLVRSGK